MKTLGLIPARSGSKRLPRKNMQQLGGKSLVALAIEQGKASSLNAVVVSSDSDEILQEARRGGAGALVRPSQFAADDTPSIYVLRHALQFYHDYDAVCLLQPTSPFRHPEDIDACLKLMHGADAVVSVSEAELSYVFEIGHAQRMREVHAMPGYYQPNGAVYVLTAEAIRAGKDWWTVDVAHAYRMPRGRSIDIDTQDDLDAAQRLLVS